MLRSRQLGSRFIRLSSGVPPNTSQHRYSKQYEHANHFSAKNWAIGPIAVVDAHCGGEPARIITSGIPEPKGNTVFEKMKYFERNYDHIRKLLLKEPRGYPAQNCDFIIEACDQHAAAGYIIMEQAEYVPMSGHNTICVATVLLETGIIPMTEPRSEFFLEAPGGVVKIFADCKHGKVERVTIRNVPSFVAYTDVEIDVPQLGKVKVDVSYGGMAYVIADVSQFGLKILPHEGRELTRIGSLIRAAANRELPFSHPENPLIEGISIVLLRAPSQNPNVNARNAVIVSTGAFSFDEPQTWTGSIDRSPCGSGTSALMAVLYEKGELKMNEEFVHESILGSTFRGRIVSETKVGPIRGIIPEISGQAWITAFSQIVLDKHDPFPEGFTVGDIWA